ncbi:hypothetical protein Acsp02_59440 [Actinoplanes sp. NBRC 103695]|nr:hypothetical protein Acsp02_59440 [Actinoplanes sp. NBRC 103695]
MIVSGGENVFPAQVEDLLPDLRERRARFCVPRDVFFLPALPRTTTGEVLTRRLRPPA